MARVLPGDAGSWQREWTVTADRIAAIGDACAARGHAVSAREAWLRASNYYRTSYLMHYGAPTAPEVLHGFERESETFRGFAERADSLLEPVEIPYEGTTLPGYFCRAPGASRPARTLIATNGYDSTIHEMYFAFAIAANRRGCHCLLFDGPGQGRVLIRQGLRMRPDWENVIRPVVDFAMTRPEIDPNRIALAGWSFGGYLALRGAGGEPRLAACAADPGLMSLLAPLRKICPDLPGEVLAKPSEADPAQLAPLVALIESTAELRWSILQRGFWVHGVRSVAEFLGVAGQYTNEGILRSIRCPVFVAWQESDPLAATAPEVYEALRAPGTLVRFLASEGAGGHCAMTGRSLLHQRMFDWLDDVLGTH
ncbi:MAG: alpha/beta fold hydrolase [Verrucomicrobiae bacterium]|nr:alpha/beta fold hydrolase [Verrucomicrobiae bacterium]